MSYTGEIPKYIGCVSESQFPKGDPGARGASGQPGFMYSGEINYMAIIRDRCLGVRQYMRSGGISEITITNDEINFKIK